MERLAASSPVSPFVRLALAFGDRLSIERDATTVCWSFDGRSAIAKIGPGGSIDASFVDRTVIDRVAHHPAAAVYARPHAAYGLDPAGCARMVDDIVAFFSGTREPRFAFVNAVERDRRS